MPDAALSTSQGQRNVSVRQATPLEMLKALESRFVGHSRGRYVLLSGLHQDARADDIMNLFLGFDVMARAINILKVSVHCEVPAVRGVSSVLQRGVSAASRTAT